MTKYCAARTKIIYEQIRAGVPPLAAAALAGVPRSTYYMWLADKPDFADGVQRAEATLIRTHLATIAQAAQTGSWQAAAWTLERRFPREFGRSVAEIYRPGGEELPVLNLEIISRSLERVDGGSVDGDERHPRPLAAPRPIRRLGQ